MQKLITALFAFGLCAFVGGMFACESEDGSANGVNSLDADFGGVTIRADTSPAPLNGPFDAAVDSAAQTGGPRAWRAPQLIESNNTGSATDPQLASDPAGNVLAVWSQIDDDGIKSIWTNRFVPATGWGKAALIENAMNPAGDVHIAMDALGNAIALWSTYDGGPVSVWTSRYVVGTGWGMPEQLSMFAAAGPFGLSTDVAGNTAGNTVAVANGDQNIWSRSYVPAMGWAVAGGVLDSVVEGARSPRIAVSPGGNAIAVWYQSDNTRFNVWTNRYVVGTGWGTATLLETADGEAYHPRVAIDKSDNAMAIWLQEDGKRTRKLWARRYVVGTGWETATQVEMINGVAVDEHPRLVVDAIGTVTVIWAQGTVLSGTQSIWSNRYVVGTGWGVPTLVETEPTGAYLPQLAVDPAGNVIAVWEQLQVTNGNHHLWANRFVPGSGWGTATLIKNNSTGSAYKPDVVVDAAGNAVAVWYQSDGGRHDIWATVYR